MINKLGQLSADEMPEGVTCKKKKKKKKKKTSVVHECVRAEDRVHVFPRTLLNFCAPLENAEVGI